MSKDKLTEALKAARAAGMRYGRYVSMQCLTPAEKESPVDNPQRSCTQCGKPVEDIRTGHGGQKRKRCLACKGR